MYRVVISFNIPLLMAKQTCTACPKWLHVFEGIHRIVQNQLRLAGRRSLETTSSPPPKKKTICTNYVMDHGILLGGETNKITKMKTRVYK